MRKGAAPVVAGLLGVGTIAAVVLATRKAPAAQEGAGASISITLIPGEVPGAVGRRMTAAYPTEVVEGSVGNKILATVTNTSTRLGVHVKTRLDVGCTVMIADPVGTGYLYPVGPSAYQWTDFDPFGSPNDTTDFTWMFDMPDGYGGWGGTIAVWVYPPGVRIGPVIDSASGAFSIAVAEIKYGATIVL